jgi:hypothetical protein
LLQVAQGVAVRAAAAAVLEVYWLVLVLLLLARLTQLRLVLVAQA